MGRNSEQSRLLPITFHAFLDQEETAEGQLYIDDGSSIGELSLFTALGIVYV